MSYRANPPGFKRLANGVYLKMEKKNHWLCLMKIGRKWSYARIYLSRTPTVGELRRLVNDKFSRTYPTRAMALSASEGNRVP